MIGGEGIEGDGPKIAGSGQLSERERRRRGAQARYVISG